MLPEPLYDGVADTEVESDSEAIVFGTGFAGISDIEVSPYDGYIYVVSLGQGKIFKILPTADLDMSASAGSIPSLPSTPPDTTFPPVGEMRRLKITMKITMNKFRKNGSGGDGDDNNNSENGESGDGNSDGGD